MPISGSLRTCAGFCLAAQLILSSCGVFDSGPAARPDILLIVMDAARADAFSCYGYERPTTPGIDRIAADGLMFTSAVSTTSWTLPSHASLFTGLTPAEHGATCQHTWLADHIPTLAELLHGTGYRTAMFSNNGWVSRQENLARGFDVYEEIWADTSVTMPEKPHNTVHTNELVKDFLATAKQDSMPFFVFINYMDVHNPYDPPEPFRSRFLAPGRHLSARVDSARMNPVLVSPEGLVLEDEEFSAVRDFYDGALAYLDGKIGELMSYLEHRGLFDSTLVIITSDHGEIFGRHGIIGHGFRLDRQLVHIPLIMHHAGLIPQPAVRREPVSITDIFHTVAGLCGVDRLAAPTGAVTTDLLDPDSETGPRYSELKVDRAGLRLGAVTGNDIRSLWTGESMHYILCSGEIYEAYELESDFDENENLVPDDVSRERVVSVIGDYEERLRGFEETEADLDLRSPLEMDPEKAEALRALGYAGGGRQNAPVSGEGKIHPHLSEHYKTAVFFMNRDSLFAAAREFEKVLRMDPGNTTVLRMLASVYYLSNRFEKAVEIYQPLYGDRTRPIQAALIMANVFRHLGRPGRALEQYRAVLGFEPEDREALRGSAEVLLENGDPDSAGVFIGRLLSFHRGDPRELIDAAALYVVHGYSDHAAAFLERELEKASSGVVCAVLAEVYRLRGEQDMAQQYHRRAARLGVVPAGFERIRSRMQRSILGAGR